MKKISKKIFENKNLLIAPFNTKLGLSLVSTDMIKAQLNPNIHSKVVESLYEILHQDIVFPLMDVFLEANAINRISKSKNEKIFTENINENMCEWKEIKDDLYLKNYRKSVELMAKTLPKKVIKGAFVTAPFTMASIINDLKKTKNDVLVENDKFLSLINLTKKIATNLVENLIEVGADFICVLDPMASLLNSGNIQKFSLKSLNDITKICNRKNVISALHICGDITPIIENIFSADFDVLSVDSEDAGVNIAKISKIIPENLVLMGNLNPKGKLFSGTSKEVESEVVKLLKSMKEERNFILGSGCDLPKNTPLENMISFVNSGRNFSK